MNKLAKNSLNTYNILSIGQRGVGKTVYLAGSYVELHTEKPTDNSQNLWFDCQDQGDQENIEVILNYIAQNHQYPPPTMKITNFGFSLKYQSRKQVETLCHFQWSDIPGEICDIKNSEFRSIVANSHGCCVFIDAYALKNSNFYLQVLEDIIEQVTAIANLVYLNELNYPFAIILTKSDLIEQDSINQKQIESNLELLTTQLEAVNANYRLFYSSIPIISTSTGSILKAKGASVSLLWLVWELNQVENPSLRNNLLKLTNNLLPNKEQSHPGKIIHGTLESLFIPTKKLLEAKETTGINKLVSNKLMPNLVVTLLLIGALGILSTLLVDYQRFFQTTAESGHTRILSEVSNLQQSGKFKQAISLLEKLVQKEPERIDLRWQLAQLYEITGAVSQAETNYDQILNQQKNHLQALIRKAILRKLQGDAENATILFKQAEKVAPTQLKAQVRAVAQNTLQSNTQVVPANK